MVGERRGVEVCLFFPNFSHLSRPRRVQRLSRCAPFSSIKDCSIWGCRLVRTSSLLRPELDRCADAAPLRPTEIARDRPGVLAWRSLPSPCCTVISIANSPTEMHLHQFDADVEA